MTESFLCAHTTLGARRVLKGVKKKKWSLSWASCSSYGGCFIVELFSHVQLFFHPIDCSPPGSSIHGITPARLLEWSSRPRDGLCVSCIGKQILHDWATREALSYGRERHQWTNQKNLEVISQWTFNLGNRSQVGRCHWVRLRKSLPLEVGRGGMGNIEEGLEEA